jgi:2Fe-2S ferredoxin
MSGKKFTIEFFISGDSKGKKIVVDPAKMPKAVIGRPGSILAIALGSKLDVDHACGGVCACSTCHVIVREGIESCSEITEVEEDQLEKAPGLTPRSRLACQTVPDGSKNLVVEVPNWNRNLVRE